MTMEKELTDSDQSTSGGFTTSGASEEERDEVKEIRKISARDTRTIHCWRLIVTCVLLITAVVITFITYTFLHDDERKNFEIAFDQFSRTLEDAAIQQQKDIRNVYHSFANTLTAYVQSNDEVQWPFVTLPLFQSYADDVLEQSRTEVFHIDIIVNREKKQEYLQWATDNYKAWMEEGHALANSSVVLDPSDYYPYFTYFENGKFLEDTEDRDIYLTTWQFSPPPNTYKIINWNIYSTDDGIAIIDALNTLKNETLFSEVRKYRVAPNAAFAPGQHEAMHKAYPGSTEEHPHSFLRVPVRERVNDPTAPVVGVISAAMAWDAPMQGLLPEGVKGLLAVVGNNCGQSFSWEINGKDAIFMGKGDLHDPKYNSMGRVANLAIHSHPDYETTPGHCQYEMKIYPTENFEETYNSNTDKVFAALVSLTFVAVAVVFFVYDTFVQRRNERLIANAARSNAIVSSMFPSNIRDRLINTNQKNCTAFKSLVSGDGINQTCDESKPLADLFLETTVLLADIAGFTAWSSVREPTHVFILLETLYQSFDKVAKARRVFKVETVGDCYVAVTGMPNPRKDHAVVMVRFAKDIFRQMRMISCELSSTLGPDTADLNLRIGLSSGQVTAGVVRGEKARFQLFGDAMDRAARIEAAGQPGRIHIAQSTADILIGMSKGHWIEKREDVVVAKGTEIQTWWVKANFDRVSKDSDHSCSNNSSRDLHPDSIDSGPKEHLNRLVDWNYKTLLNLIKQVIAHRNAVGRNVVGNQASGHRAMGNSASLTMKGVSPLEEVQEIITLPEFDSKAALTRQNPNDVEVALVVQQQLKTFVTCIGTMYRENPFHNFEHASHVTMSVMKLLSRIIAPSEILDKDDKDDHEAEALHDHTYGITSDPMTQFACAFSALIHDVDHLGVPNATLVKENASVAAVYKNRSVAEQNSLVLSWDLLNKDMFSELRSVLFTNEEEKLHFRQLVVNMVLATDIVDKELKELRNARWEKAFKDNAGVLNREDPRAVVNRKATIVIEHLIQASDVAHTMQHWHIYRKWNERFFIECYSAYKMGRSESNPADNWYKGEMGFFDFYIIPLARKLKDCGIFGKSSDEYLNYAVMNRKEWEAKGQAIVEAMVEKVENDVNYGSQDFDEIEEVLGITKTSISTEN